MDRTAEMLASYACRLSYEDLGPKTVHQVKRTLVDTMGCAMGGFVSEPAKIARGMASSIASTTPSRAFTSLMLFTTLSYRLSRGAKARVAIPWSIKAMGPCFISPAGSPSAWM